MGKSQPSGGIRSAWFPQGHIDGTPTKRCCTACRRGTPAFGETTCGLPGCRCHIHDRTAEKEITEMNGEGTK